MDFRNTIIAHAKTAYPQEACGFVMHNPHSRGLIAEKAENVWKETDESKREDHFRIDPGLTLEKIKSGNLRAVYHSHSVGSSAPSAHDIATVEGVQLPLYCYSVQDEEMSCQIPEFFRLNLLEGRNYLPLVHDCASLVQDYYLQKLQIDSPFLPRTYKQGIFGHTKLLDYMESIGMERMPEETLQEHDVLIMALKSPMPNHAAVYLGETRMLHQVEGEPSAITIYGGWWKHCTTMIFRHPKFIK